MEAGLTTPLAIGIATNMSNEAIVSPTEEQGERLNSLLNNYILAIRMVNAVTMKERL